MSVIDTIEKYYARFPGRVVKSTGLVNPDQTIDYLFQSIADSIENSITYVNGLTTVRQTGKGAQLWTDFWRIFLSRREEKTDFAFADKATAVSDNLFGGFDASKIGDPVTILDFEKAGLSIHKARGTEDGITADIKRICNNETVTVTYNGQDKCGWVGDVTSPELTPALLYDLDNSLCFMDLDNMVVVDATNASNRTINEIEKIIRHDFVPIKYNLKTNIINVYPRS